MKIAWLVVVIGIAAILPRSETIEHKRERKTTIPKHFNYSRLYSPLVLNRTWPTLPKLFTSVAITIFGTIMNSYYVASFFIARDLRKIGNVFQACVGLSDMLISGGILITCVVVLISGHTLDTPEVCHGVQTLGAASTYCHSIFFSLVALVSWCRVNQTRKFFRKCLPTFVGLLCITVVLFGFTLAIAGTYLQLDYDYCQRQHQGNYIFRLATNAIHGIMCFMIVTTLIASYLKLKRRNRGNGHYRRSYEYHRDLSLMKLNLVMYLIYVLCWLPYMIVVNFYPQAPDSLLYQTAMLGTIQPLIRSLLYGFCSNIFSKSYVDLFNYCWCRISFNNKFQSRQGRNGNGTYTRNRPDLRTHILLQPAFANGPQQDL